MPSYHFGNCVLEQYIMVAASASDVDLVDAVLGVDVTGPWRFLCSKDRVD